MDSVLVAKLWATVKKNKKMNYEKLSRAMRYLQLREGSKKKKVKYFLCISTHSRPFGSWKNQKRLKNGPVLSNPLPPTQVSKIPHFLKFFLTLPESLVVLCVNTKNIQIFPIVDIITNRTFSGSLKTRDSSTDLGPRQRIGSQ